MLHLLRFHIHNAEDLVSVWPLYLSTCLSEKWTAWQVEQGWRQSFSLWDCEEPILLSFTQERASSNASYLLLLCPLCLALLF